MRRLGHSVHVIDESHFVPTEWTGTTARILRKLFRGVMVNELTRRSIESMEVLSPDALFVFKGNYVAPEILLAARRLGIPSVNYYPDVSFLSHGKQLPRTLPHYDHVFNAKTFGIADMHAAGIKSVSFLPPGYDPELHRPVELSDDDRTRFGCDVSFIGTWSPKKERILSELRRSCPDVQMRIWGYQWERRETRLLDDDVMGVGITGDLYTRAICASRIALGLLSEARTGASSGDLITARTFQIPACGAFMLHERNAEALSYFDEGKEAGFFGSGDELAAMVRHYLANESDRRQVAAGGLKRSLEAGYATDSRMQHIADWVLRHRESRMKKA